MFMINGTNYTFHLLALISFSLLFMLQYLLCKKANRRVMKLIPVCVVIFIFILATVILFTPQNSIFDLRGLVAVLLYCYGLVCAVAVGLAWIVYKMKKRK